MVCSLTSTSAGQCLQRLTAAVNKCGTDGGPGTGPAPQMPRYRPSPPPAEAQAAQVPAQPRRGAGRPRYSRVQSEGTQVRLLGGTAGGNSAALLAGSISTYDGSGPYEPHRVCDGPRRAVPGAAAGRPGAVGTDCDLFLRHGSSHWRVIDGRGGGEVLCIRVPICGFCY